MRFSYSCGQRPLDGYTIKRGIGKGGFGEVYYALSDGGKEVALKLVRGDEQVELRGVAQCLNLKHPNLVSLYDLRTDNNGDHWVVMEYVAGEPLSAVISRHPGGVPRELVREWFLGIARAVSYLHDHGIVHRDLKPANVFLENGTLKIGDYGLSKSISTSQRTAQTQTVGTVHYMAPEISTGNYNKQVDVYAAGVILYEMVTGKVPFDGESAGEILMKHLTSPPDMNRVPAEWKAVVAKALAKNPAHRYANMSEMARDVEAVTERGRQAPARPAAKAREIPEAEPVELLTPPRRQEAERAEARQPRPEPMATATLVVTGRQQLMELSWSMVKSALFAAIGVGIWGLIRYERNASWSEIMPPLLSLFFVTLGACWVVLVPGKFWTEQRGDSWTRRVVMLVLGGALGLFACYADGWSPGRTWRLEEISQSGVHVFPRGVLRPGVLRAAVVADDEPAAVAALQLRAAARRGLLGGGPVAAAPPAAPAGHLRGHRRPDPDGRDRAAGQPLGTAAAPPAAARAHAAGLTPPRGHSEDNELYLTADTAVSQDRRIGGRLEAIRRTLAMRSLWLSIAVVAGVLLAAGCADRPAPPAKRQVAVEDGAGRKTSAKLKRKKDKEAAPEKAKPEQAPRDEQKDEPQSAVVTGYGETNAAARANALVEVQEWLERELRKDLKPGWSVPRKLLDPAYLEKMGVINVKDADPPSAAPFKDVKDDEQARQQQYKVTLTPQYVSAVVAESRSEWVAHEQQERQSHAVARQHVLLRVLGGVLALLLVVAGYLRLEEATRGYYTTLLRMVALGVLGAVVLGLLMIG
jgi:hypothetical protein